MKKLIFISVIIVIFLSGISPAFADTRETDLEWYNLLLISNSVEGTTGLFNVPSTGVVPKSGYCMGVHRYKFKYNVGLIPNLEAGFMFDAEEFEDFDKESLKKVRFNAKYNLLKEEHHPVAFSVGVENREFYAVASRYFPDFFNFALHPGLKITRQNQGKPFIGITKLNWRVLFITDFDDDSYSFGMRVLLHQKLRFDFFLTKLEDIRKVGFDSIVFGISFAE